jgi:N-acetylmuramic acid 6-phosphate etherase
MMVNLRIDNAKLRRRAIGTLMRITGCGEREAASALDRCSGRMKPAVLVAAGVQPDEADRLLNVCGGNLRAAFARRH